MDRRQYGFHGSGSVDPWSVVAHAGSEAVLQWTGHGLGVSRRLALDGSELFIESEAHALADAVPMIMLEHCTVGLDTLDPEVTLRLPAAVAYEVDDHDGPIRPPDRAPIWPQVRLLDGDEERGDRWPLAQPRSRWIVLHDVPEGSAEVINARYGTGIALRWDTTALPHLHIWHEAGDEQRFWRGRACILGVEPTNVPHGLGLAEAIRADQAHWVQPDRSLRWWVTARALADH